MVQPPIFEQTSNSPHLVCKLQKAMYALKQAPRALFEKLKSFLLNNLDFRVLIADSCLFTKSNVDFFVLLLVYVDDIVITGTSSILVDEVIKSIYAHFKLKDLGSINYFLGMEVTSGEDYLLLNQKKYVHELLLKIGVSVMPNLLSHSHGRYLSKSYMYGVLL